MKRLAAAKDKKEYDQDIVKKIDLETIQWKVQKRKYGSLAQIRADVDLLLENAKTFWLRRDPNSEILKYGYRLHALFHRAADEIEAGKWSKDYKPPADDDPVKWPEGELNKLAWFKNNATTQPLSPVWPCTVLKKERKEGSISRNGGLYFELQLPDQVQATDAKEYTESFLTNKEVFAVFPMKAVRTSIELPATRLSQEMGASPVLGSDVSSSSDTEDDNGNLNILLNTQQSVDPIQNESRFGAPDGERRS